MHFLLLIRLSFLLLTGVTSCSTSSNDEVIKEEVSEENLELKVVKADNVSIKRLNTTNNADGSVTTTLSYSVTPTYATNTGISVAVKFKDGTSCSSFLTASVNTTSKIITIKCLKAFSKQILLTATASDGSGASATMTIDYEKKLTKLDTGAWDSFSVSIYEDFTNFAGDTELKGAVINQTYFYSPTYSLCSVDKSYTYKVEIVSKSFDEGNSVQHSMSHLDDCFLTAMDDAILNGTAFSVSNLMQRAQYYEEETDLVNWVKESQQIGVLGVSMDYKIKITCNEDTTKTTQTDVTFGISLDDIDVDSYEVAVSGINLESTSLLF